MLIQPKLRCFCLSLLLVIFSVPAAARAVAPDYDGVERAMQSGNAKALSAMITGRVALTVDGEEKPYTQAQAEFVLKKFFRENPPKSYKWQHKLASDKFSLGIGEFRSQNRKSFRVTVTFSKTGNLIELRFEFK